MKKPILPKFVTWILLVLLVLLDAVLDIIRGREGNPLWKPVVEMIGVNNVPFLVPLILVLFYLFVKACAKLIEKFDKTPNSEELVLTSLVLIYSIYDIWIIAVDFLNFKLITDFRFMIIPLTIIGLAYALWAQKRLK